MAEPQLEPRFIGVQVPGLKFCLRCVSGQSKALYPVFFSGGLETRVWFDVGSEAERWDRKKDVAKVHFIAV